MGQIKKAVKWLIIGVAGYIVIGFTGIMIYAAFDWYNSPERAKVLRSIEAGETKRESLIDYILF